MINYIEYLTNVEQTHSQDTTCLIIIYNYFNILLDFTCYSFLELFCIYIYERYWHIVFLCSLCVWSEDNACLIRNIRKYLLLFYFLEEFCRFGVVIFPYIS